MVKHIWSILCKRTVVDSETNNVSIFDTLEELKIDVVLKKSEANKPINIPLEYEVLSFWVRDTKSNALKLAVELGIHDPSGKEVKSFPLPVEFTPGVARMRSRIKIKGFIVNLPGIYNFVVKFKEEDEKEFKEVAEIPLEIILNKKIEETN